MRTLNLDTYSRAPAPHTYTNTQSETDGLYLEARLDEGEWTEQCASEGAGTCPGRHIGRRGFAWPAVRGSVCAQRALKAVQEWEVERGAGDGAGKGHARAPPQRRPASTPHHHVAHPPEIPGQRENKRVRVRVRACVCVCVGRVSKTRRCAPTSPAPLCVRPGKACWP
jgi:hypothetical protein